MGFHLIVHPLSTFYASARALLDVLKILKENGTTRNHLHKMATFEEFKEFNQLVNLESWLELEARYLNLKKIMMEKLVLESWPSFDLGKRIPTNRNITGWFLHYLPKTMSQYVQMKFTVFNYDPTIHNVVAVNRGSYSSCKTPGGAKVLKSGKDRIKLVKGQNFFICSFSGHCQSGMKIAVNAV